MKRLFCFASILVLIFAGHVHAQDVAIVYDEAIENGGGLAVPNPAQLAEMMVEELEAKKLTAEIVDADGLVEYMNANPKGIYIITQGNTPGTIFNRTYAKLTTIEGFLISRRR